MDDSEMALASQSANQSAVSHCYPLMMKYRYCTEGRKIPKRFEVRTL